MSLQDVVRYLNVRNRVRHPELPGSGEALERSDGRVVARFLDLVITSRFLPVSELARGRVVGHSAHLVGLSRQSTPLDIDQLFARSRHDEEVVFLDRLCRTLHALNFVERNLGSQLLLLDVSPRHLLAVHEHGTVFESILNQLNLAPSQVVIAIDPERSELGQLRSAFRNFQARGFRLALDHFGRGSSNLDRLLSLEPEFVRLDAALLPQVEKSDRLRSTLESLVTLGRTTGARVIVPGVDDEARLQLARQAGADWIQGELALGRASERPSERPTDRPSDHPTERAPRDSATSSAALVVGGAVRPTNHSLGREEPPASCQRSLTSYEQIADANETTRVDLFIGR
ncbi:MAG TPA: EAL domain-containing protein [Polyangiaceae bacterium]|nr:EAL domain-containing protein [Polyangiaceae bacterium]